MCFDCIDGKVGLRAGFPSPSVILNTGGLDQLPTEEPLALIVESWSHRFCLDKKGHCFSSYKGGSVEFVHFIFLCYT